MKKRPRPNKKCNAQIRFQLFKILYILLFTSFSLHQHTLQALAQNFFDVRDPFGRLALDALVVIFSRLADERKHLRQQPEPFLAELLRERALALYGRETRVRGFRSHVLEQDAVHVAVRIGS